MKHDSRLISAILGIVSSAPLLDNYPPKEEPIEVPKPKTQHDLAAIEKAQAKRLRKNSAKLAKAVCRGLSSSLYSN